MLQQQRETLQLKEPSAACSPVMDFQISPCTIDLCLAKPKIAVECCYEGQSRRPAFVQEELCSKEELVEVEP